MVLVTRVAPDPRRRTDRPHSALHLLRQVLSDDMVFVDVGAYLGEFATAVLEMFPAARGILFEPTEQSAGELRKRLEWSSSIRILDLALSNESGEHDFFVGGNAPANSLLGSSSRDEVRKTSVRIDTLDRVLNGLKDFSQVSLIKVDTQGNDLKVLYGAEDTIRRYSPAILVEVIFIALYQNQGSCFDIFEFMKQHRYELGGVFETHATQEGLVAFADLLFLPSQIHAAVSPKFGHKHPYVCTDIAHLVSQNKLLKETCEERLELIHRLKATADERLKVIEVLDSEVQRLSGRNRN